MDYLTYPFKINTLSTTTGMDCFPNEKNKSKMNYMYLLTPKGISAKTKLTINFMKKKMVEYDELQKELGDN